MSLAELRVARALREVPIRSFDYRTVMTYAPRLSGAPLWFVSASQIDGQADRGDLSLFTQLDARSPWLKSLSVDVGTTPLAGIALRDKDGAARLPDAAAAARGHAALVALARYLATGRADPQLAVEGTGAAAFVQEVRRQRLADRALLSLRTSCVVEAEYERAIRQADGTLVLGSVRCTIDETARRGGTVDLRGAYRVLSATKDRLAGFQVVAEHLVAVSVADRGPARVLGDSASTVAVYGNGAG